MRFIVECWGWGAGGCAGEGCSKIEKKAGEGLRSLRVNGVSRTGVDSFLVPNGSANGNGNGNGIGRNDGDARPMAKFMLSLRQDSMRIISSEAGNRGISVQELLRAVIIPEWVKMSLREG